MHSGSAPIGFEGILSTSRKSLIGFEQYEGTEKEQPVYPLADTMPNPYPSLQNDYTHSHLSSRKNVPYRQLVASYDEIVNRWFDIPWLTFADNHQETFLTLNIKTEETITIQTAIDQFRLTTGNTPILSQSECLLIRTKSKSKTIFVPNAHISIGSLYDSDNNENSCDYKLIAIVSHLNETENDVMFYKDIQTDYWYIYYPQSTSSTLHSGQLSHEEQSQLQSFIQLKDHINPSQLATPLTALCNNPIVYVYVSENTQ